jgi:isopenicillin N synthase-like dioxygenase
MSVATAVQPALDQVPVIDFGPFGTGIDEGSRQVAQKIAAACAGTGFFYLTRHGVPEAKIAATFEAARHFFARPEQARLDPSLLVTPQETRGYMPLGARHYPGTGAPDLMEAFKLQAELSPDDPDLVAGNRGQQRNKWPTGDAAFRTTLLDYFGEMTRLSHRLLAAFAVALDLAPDHFLPFFRKPQTQLSLLHYPPQAPAAAADAYGIRPHADATAFTILCQDAIGGLQVAARDGGWIAVPPIAGTYVINIGDMMARWTNDRFASTKHRVFNRTGQERYSLPFFGIPDFDAIVACLPTCEGPGNPAKYPPIHVGEFIRRKNASDWAGEKG